MARNDSEDAHAIVGATPGEAESFAAAHLYWPLDPESLLPGSAIAFDLYALASPSRLETLLYQGDRIPADLVDRAARECGAVAVYALLEQIKSVARFQEETISQILEDRHAPLATKCRAARSLILSLSRVMFDDPTARNIDRQRANVSRVVELALREPAAVQILLGLVERDPTPSGHMASVGIYGLAAALNGIVDCGSEDQLRRTVTAFFLFDLGKARLPPGLLEKTGALTPLEWGEVRRHPALGRAILAETGTLTFEAETLAMQHHEKVDGSGYPNELEGADIHPYARVCSLLDAFDALTCDRPYHDALTPFDALARMKSDLCAQFDPEVFRKLVLLLGRPDRSAGDRRQTRDGKLAAERADDSPDTQSH